MHMVDIHGRAKLALWTHDNRIGKKIRAIKLYERIRLIEREGASNKYRIISATTIKNKGYTVRTYLLTRANLDGRLKV